MYWNGNKIPITKGRDYIDMFEAKMTKNGCLYYLCVREFVCLLMCIQMCVSEMDIDHIFKQATGTLLSRVILSAEKLSLNSFLLKLKKGPTFCILPINFRLCDQFCVQQMERVQVWLWVCVERAQDWRGIAFSLPTHTGFGNKQPMGALET